MTGDELLAFINTKLFPELKNLIPIGGAGDRRRVVADVFEDAYNYMKSGQLMRQVVNKINGIDFNNLTDRQHFGDIYEQILTVPRAYHPPAQAGRARGCGAARWHAVWRGRQDAAEGALVRGVQPPHYYPSA
jgi:hypothetical protein